MHVYRIHRLKETARQQFRWAPHTIGVSTIRPKDYDAAAESVEGRTAYAVWLELKDTGSALQPGDILESEDGDLRIYKYVGFEQAQWQAAELRPELSGPTEAAEVTEAPAQGARR